MLDKLSAKFGNSGADPENHRKDLSVDTVCLLQNSTGKNVQQNCHCRATWFQKENI